jgi:hypothetical protein
LVSSVAMSSVVSEKVSPTHHRNGRGVRGVK